MRAIPPRWEIYRLVQNFRNLRRDKVVEQQNLALELFTARTIMSGKKPLQPNFEYKLRKYVNKFL